jgi:dienelactone hydrolase
MNKSLIIFAIGCSMFLRSEAQIKGSLWDVKGIHDTPKYRVISSDSVVGIFYEGLNYKNHPQNVFAYYSTPGIITGDKSKDKNLPAVVLVHGGGGAAFPQWVAMWARKGYAAIAMDWRGNGPDGKHIENGFEEVNGNTPFFTIFPNLNEQWMFQAIADVILAHNLIRSFPEVDSNRTALTGISWGGIITLTMSGLDNRYKVAVPVYGGGFFPTSVFVAQQLNALNPTDINIWLKQYDPSRHVGEARMPILFVNGSNDGGCYLDSYARTYRLVKNKTLSVQVGLLHGHYGHGAGMDVKETIPFIDSYINGTKALCSIEVPTIKNDKIEALVNLSVPILKVYLNYTTDTAGILMDRKWNTVEVSLVKNKIVSSLPPINSTMWFLSAIDERGLKTSSEVQFVEDKLRRLVYSNQ